MIPAKSLHPFDVAEQKMARLFSERSDDGHSYTTRWNPIMFAVITLVGQMKAVAENMRKQDAASNARIRQLHDDFATAQLAAMRRPPGKSTTPAFRVVG